MPQRTFADVEFLRQGVQLEPTLKTIAAFLDRHASLVDGVRRDLLRGLKRPTTGRRGLTAAQTLRSLILMRVKHWDYRELRERITDGYTLRSFTHTGTRVKCSEWLILMRLADPAPPPFAHTSAVRPSRSRSCCVCSACSTACARRSNRRPA